MFEQFTDRARRALVLAGHKGQRDDDNNVLVDTALLLYGVLGAQEPVVSNLVTPRGFVLDPSEDVAPGGSAVPFRGVFTDDAKAALAAAREESKELGHNAIDTRHLLLGLMKVNQDDVGQHLSAVGVDVDPSQLRTELRTAL